MFWKQLKIFDETEIVQTKFDVITICKSQFYNEQNIKAIDCTLYPSPCYQV